MTTTLDDTYDETGEIRRGVASRVDDAVEEIDRELTLTDRERAIAQVAARVTAREVQGVIRDALPPGFRLRLAQLETHAKETNQHRLNLTGVDDRNGRFGRLEQRVEAHHAEVTAAIAAVRADLGTPQERIEERAITRALATAKKWALAKLLGFVVAAATAIYGYLQLRDDARSAAAAATARTETRLEHLEKTSDSLLNIFLRQRTP